MDTDTLVEQQLEDGQKLFAELLQRGFDATAAFWIQPSYNGKWYYYMVSPTVDTEGITNAYGRLSPLVRAIPQPFSIDPLKIRLIGASDPVARDVLAIVGRASGTGVGPSRWRGTLLGGTIIDGAYLYPVPATTP